MDELSQAHFVKEQPISLQLLLDVKQRHEWEFGSCLGTIISKCECPVVLPLKNIHHFKQILCTKVLFLKSVILWAVLCELW